MTGAGSLMRFNRILDLEELSGALYEPIASSEGLLSPVGLDEAEIDPKVVASGLEAAAEITALEDCEKRVDAAEADLEALKLIHPPLKVLPRSVASDPRLWSFLGCGYGRLFTWRRWGKRRTLPETSREILGALTAEGSELAGRFQMKGGGLGAVSRHALARLWWLGEATEGDYVLAGKLLSNQDIFQAIFEREIGFVPKLAELLVEVFDIGGPDAPTGAFFRSTIMTKVQQLAITTRIETLDDHELRNLLEILKAELS